MNYPKRKSNRLNGYDYGQNGAYFVTICTQNRVCLFKEIVGEGFHALPHVELSAIGVEIEKSIIHTHEQYRCIDKYVIMPNHIHIIIAFQETDRHGSLSLQDIISRLKSFTTLKYNEMHNQKNLKLWQRSYHDHIIRNEAEYLKIWNYIDTNPFKWADDCYYI
ncbi:transposase [Bengtsoniella intestinalis]|uniref:transposase n=1 Tax=Bengtsoniella intestinalis TaxID=3073143 RepID=UPI00391F941F